MRFLGKVLICVTAIGGTGCVVHDGSKAPEPIWWPTFVVRDSTLAATGGQLRVQVADPILPPLSADPPVGRRAD